MSQDVQKCFERNIHNRTEEEIKEIVDYWSVTPEQYMRIDPSSLTNIVDVEMEDVSNDEEEIGAGEVCRFTHFIYLFFWLQEINFKRNLIKIRNP